MKVADDDVRNGMTKVIQEINTQHWHISLFLFKIAGEGYVQTIYLSTVLI
jgi:hypothetical protein